MAVIGTSGKMPFTPKCRDPKCSFQCHRWWAAKESAIIAHAATLLPASCRWFQGCLKLPACSSLDDHKKAAEKFFSAIRRVEKFYGCVIRFRGAYHAADPASLHIDFQCFSDLSPTTLRDELKRIRQLAGYTGSLKRSRSPKKAAAYNFKADAAGPVAGKGAYLLAKGTPNLFSSSRFFEPTGRTADELWEEWKAKLYPERLQLKDSVFTAHAHPLDDTDNQLDMVQLRLEAERLEAVSQAEQLVAAAKWLGKVLPTMEHEGRSAECLAWVSGYGLGTIREAMKGIPDARRAPSGAWYRTASPFAGRWVDRMFPDGNIPFHAEHTADLIGSDADKVENIVKHHPPPVADEMDEATFIALLRAALSDPVPL